MTQQSNKKTYRRGFKKWADDKTIELRQEMGLFANSHLCAFDLCDYLKIPVWTPEEIPGITESFLKELLITGCSHWSAASIPLGNEKYLIVHNPKHSEARQQSNLMHELAHIICDHKVNQEKAKLGLSGFLRNYNEDQENEAEWLGACLQLPRPALLYALKRNMSNDEISLMYKASPEMVKYRINITGVKRQLSYFKRR